ncbi:hypothetical protein AVEN_188340-1 [Araneus ventricosus]|uniref:Uncharacterized protein n=1 Tax=Araneus ventricosus TaxID=182803 RepID=A0A4Y2VKC0_ARAVE|nr:hypothetical protein AVEN_188340-1 [Araneus ventricosus]
MTYHPRVAACGFRSQGLIASYLFNLLGLPRGRRRGGHPGFGKQGGHCPGVTPMYRFRLVHRKCAEAGNSEPVTASLLGSAAVGPEVKPMSMGSSSTWSFWATTTSSHPCRPNFPTFFKLTKSIH